MTVKGKIKVIGDTATFGSSGFRKRELVVTTAEQYPQDLMIEFVQDKCDLLDKCKVGESIEVSINLRGKCWTNPEGVDKYFNSIQGWRLESVNIEEKSTEVPVLDSNEPNDLPF